MISVRNIHQFLHGPLWGCGGQCGPVQAVSQAGSVLASIHSPFSLRRRYLPFRTVYFFLRMMMDIWPGLHLTTWMISFLHYFSKAESTHIILCQLTRILRGIKNIKLSPNSGPGGLLEYLAVTPHPTLSGGNSPNWPHQRTGTLLTPAPGEVEFLSACNLVHLASE